MHGPGRERATMSEPHTLRSFDEALEKLAAGLVVMGEGVCGMIHAGGTAMQAQDVEAAALVVEQDLAVDRQFEDIRTRCLDTLLRFHPVARDLRQVMAVEHAVGDLERAADHAKSIAKRVISSPSHALSGARADLFARLVSAALGAMEDALDAFARRDADLALRVIRGDRALDVLHDDLFHTVIAGLKSRQRAVQDVQLLFAAKSLERIGDHATNIAEEAMFMTLGDQPSATRGRA